MCLAKDISAKYFYFRICLRMCTSTEKLFRWSCFCNIGLFSCVDYSACVLLHMACSVASTTIIEFIFSSLHEEWMKENVRKS